MDHKDCISKDGFSSSIEFVKLLEVSQEDEVRVLFKEICQDCGNEIGGEVQRFKYDYTEEII